MRPAISSLLAQTLLEFAVQQRTFVTLEDLAEPFSRQIVTHLHTTEKQGTSPSSQFLTACNAYIAGEMAHEQLLDTTVRLGFQNVIDAFHVVNRADTPVRFFTDERTGRTKGLALTEDLTVGAAWSAREFST